MDIKQIKKLIDIVKQNNVSELEVKNDQEAVHIVLNPNTNIATSVITSAPAAPVAVIAPALDSAAATVEATLEETYKPEDVVTSPMVGTVYMSANPGKDPFVKLGDTVKTGDTLCLIEAMKMFNRIEAHKSGKITHILIEDSQSVEYGQPLFVIE